MTLEEFRTAFPEFDSAGDALVNAKLALATSELSNAESDWGIHYEEALGNLVAHLLWTSPFGAAMRLDGGDDGEVNESRYSKELAKLRVKFIPSIIVL